jgi:hypothetical protein
MAYFQTTVNDDRAKTAGNKRSIAAANPSTSPGSTRS